MKFLRVINPENSQPVYGVLRSDRIYLLDRSALDGGKETGLVIMRQQVKTFLPPVEPPNIIALGLNYRQHAQESGKPVPTSPVIFLKATTSLVGHLSPVVLPREAPAEVDYEAELVVVIGKKAKRVSEKEALEYVFGYTCGNDISARDCQLRVDQQWARGKSFDSFAPVGPWVETDLDPNNLKIRLALNGQTMQDSSTGDMIFPVPKIVSYLSQQMTLLPGTIIMTGTPSGVGFARQPPVFLKPGDVLEVEIEGIGCLRNHVVAEG
ncbi:MAG: fumarylacetoacetate hydrolase family protein [Candidatus Omnitrophica bacterium]|nr:fumarylacetoacetate hydrolase family protein [Candidatus Omnitrophota bacterium]MCM8769314.1 fumarylacetoacetate hydrolase family protein [Candidatus Omnitrophota bacterium]